MKLQAGDRVWLNEQNFAELYCTICHDEKVYDFRRDNGRSIFNYDIFSGIGGVISTTNLDCLLDNLSRVPDPSNWDHLVEQLYCEEAFPWQ